MLAPLAPHFTSTLWYGFTAAPDRLDQSNEILWSENVTKQKWPKVDPDHLLPVRCRVSLWKMSKKIFWKCNRKSELKLYFYL